MPLHESQFEQLPTFVTHLECSMTGAQRPADQLAGLSEVGRPLLVRYDLAELAKHVSKDALAQRPPDFWRYRDSRRQDPNRVHAIEYSVAGAVRSIQVRPSGLQRPLPLDMVKRVGR